MDPQLMTKSILQFNKSLFDSTFKTISIFQEQSERMITSFVDKAAWLPEDGKTVIHNWLSTHKKLRDEIKAAADDKYETITDYFTKNNTM